MHTIVEPHLIGSRLKGESISRITVMSVRLMREGKIPKKEIMSRNTTQTHQNPNQRRENNYQWLK